jgi:hypothetical protein
MKAFLHYYICKGGETDADGDGVTRRSPYDG